MSSTREEANLQLFSNAALVFFSPSGKKFFFNSLPKSAERVGGNPPPREGTWANAPRSNTCALDPSPTPRFNTAAFFFQAILGK